MREEIAKAKTKWRQVVAEQSQSKNARGRNHQVHIRFKGGKTETLITSNTKPSGEQVKTPPEIIQLVDRLLDNHIYAEFADVLNQQRLRPRGISSPGRGTRPLFTGGSMMVS